MRPALPLLLLLAAARPTAPAASVAPRSLADQVGSAHAICTATVVRQSVHARTSGSVPVTDTVFALDSTLKGVVPAEFTLSHAGGGLGQRIWRDSGSPDFAPGESRLLFITRRDDGTLACAAGEADAPRLSTPPTRAEAHRVARVAQWVAVLGDSGLDLSPAAAPRAGRTARAAPGLIGYTNGVPARFTACDRGEPIPCWADLQALPPGITTNQALAALNSAFAAWSNASSARFRLVAVTNFGTAAPFFQPDSGGIHIQFHDLFGHLGSSPVLGNSGQSAGFTYFPTGGEGGRIGTQEFFSVTSAYVILKHTNTLLSVPASLAEVLAHELGHTLGLAHSLETNVTLNPILTNALMYYVAHLDGRGASPAFYDSNTVTLAYPHDPPPWTFHRYLDVTSSAFGAVPPAVNSVELRGFDLHSTNLTLITTNGANPNGTFSLAGSTLTFTPSAGTANFVHSTGDLTRFSPGDPTDSAYDTRFYRVSDGSNRSPWSIVRVISYRRETLPAFFPDGLPDSWMIRHFGHPDPSFGPGRLATDDFDGDGAGNLREYLDGTSPVNANSRLAVTAVTVTSVTFRTTPYLVYQLQRSSNLLDWTRVSQSLRPATNLATLPLPAAGPRLYHRIERVP